MNPREVDYKKITDQLIDVGASAILNWSVFSKVVILTFSNEYPKSREFIQVIRIACLSAFTTELNKLVDKSGFSLYKARDYLKNNLCLFNQIKNNTNELIKHIDNKLAMHDQVIMNLRKHRNRYHVHLDINEFNESGYSVFNKYPIQFSDLESLLISLCSCLGDLLSIYRKNRNDPFHDYFAEGYIKRFLIDKESVATELNMEDILASLKSIA
jgi:hypothetical protein